MDIGHYFREYRRLMTHWKSRFAADIFDFDYDALVHDPGPALQGLCTFLGIEAGEVGPQNAAPVHAIKTASVWQAREPLYSSSSGRWRNYSGQIQELRDYLADLETT